MNTSTMINTTYSAYIWVNNLYMNQKQWGIQTAHCISDMSRHSFGKEVYDEWADSHKTIIMFEGTKSGRIRRIFEIIKYVADSLNCVGIEIPHTIFREDEESLDGATTACGFIIPNVIRDFTWDSYFDRDNTLHWSDPFLPVLERGDGLDQEIDCSTEAYYQLISSRIETYSQIEQQYAASGKSINLSSLVDYRKFRLTEFSEWMRRQRLAD